MCIHFLIALSNKNAKKHRAVNIPNSPILDSNTIPNTKEPEFLREMVDSRPRQGIHTHEVNLYLFFFFFLMLGNKGKKSLFFKWGHVTRSLLGFLLAKSGIII